jgi:hypothetical protein
VRGSFSLDLQVLMEAVNSPQGGPGDGCDLK